MIVDTHLHLWERIEGRIANETPVVPLRDGMIRIGEAAMLGMPAYMLDCAARAEYAVAEFNAAGVDVGVVVQEYMDGAQNEYLRAVLQRYPDRFLAHALPNFWNTSRASEEALSLLDQGFCGIKLPAEHLLGKLRLDDAALQPLWRVMEERQAVLAVDLAEGEAQAAELENILARYPALHVALGHFGMVTRHGWPAQLQLARHPNVYLETGGIVWLYRHEGFPFPGAVAAIRQAADEVGMDKLMWGSDWPRTMIDFTYRQSLDFVRAAAEFNDEEKRLLLGENARRLYRIPPPDVSRQAVALVTEG